MSSRLKTWTAGLLLLAGLATARAEVRVGESFPSLGGLAPEEAPAGRVTLVDFWASWCAPCKDSFPAYAQLHTDYRERGLVIVAVSVDENEAAFAAFLKKYTPPFTTKRDEGHRLARQVGVPAMPTCYLLGPDGRVRYVHRGFHGAETSRELRRQIDSLLAETPTTP